MEFGKDFLDMLNESAATAAWQQVSDEDVKSFAMKMAKNGYRFDAQTLGLVRPYLEGRGLMLQGNVGIGKTFFFQTAGIEAAVNLKIAQAWSLTDIAAALDSFIDVPLLVDDVGAEELDYVSYGNKTVLFTTIIEHRMNAWAPTHFTTNLNPDQLLERYGVRVMDRVAQLAVRVDLKGESKRGPNAIRPNTRIFEDFIKGKLWRQCATRCKFYDECSHKCLKGIEYEPRKVEACTYF